MFKSCPESAGWGHGCSKWPRAHGACCCLWSNIPPPLLAGQFVIPGNPPCSLVDKKVGAAGWWALGRNWGRQPGYWCVYVEGGCVWWSRERGQGERFYYTGWTHLLPCGCEWCSRVSLWKCNVFFYCLFPGLIIHGSFITGRSLTFYKCCEIQHDLLRLVQWLELYLGFNKIKMGSCFATFVVSKPQASILISVIWRK